MSTELLVDEITLLPIRPIAEDRVQEVSNILTERGIQVAIKPPILRPRGAYDARRRQFRAEALMERARLCTERPVLAVTDADCYAGDLNFVFGVADVGGGVALVALHKLAATARHDVFRQRLAKEVIHELCHAQGLGHCRHARCVMRFSNSLAETDAKSADLCPECRRRLRDIVAAKSTGQRTEGG